MFWCNIPKLLTEENINEMSQMILAGGYESVGEKMAMKAENPDFEAYLLANRTFAIIDPMFGPTASKALFDGWVGYLQRVTSGYRPLHVEHCKCGCSAFRQDQIDANNRAKNAMGYLESFKNQTLIS